MSGQVTWQARFESARSNRLFELFIILVIIASALLVGVKTYQLPSWVKPVIDGLDLLITLIFLVEISIRFLGCLLYTSPSPRDATLSRMPSSA